MLYSKTADDTNEMDAEILNKEKGEKEHSNENDKSGFFMLLFSAVMLVSLVAWSFTHYLY